ncbi:MAG: STAS domain-containing protein [Verrucomicrobia bacterium]|nr:STAS domain-containing protein [Verrucomicrobiota bacterium]
MTCSHETSGSMTIVNLGGDVDSVSASELETRIMSLLDGGVKNLLIDCSHLTYINSAGLRVFLLAAKQLSTEGALAFCGLVPNVRLVFETIGFDRILTIYLDRATALSSMNTAATSAD